MQKPYIIQDCIDLLLRYREGPRSYAKLFKEWFNHMTIDCFPSIEQQLKLLGLFTDQVLGFRRILGQIVEFPLFGCLPDNFHVIDAESRLVALSPVKPFVGILLIFSVQVGEKVTGLNVFTCGLGCSRCGMNGGENIRT